MAFKNIQLPAKTIGFGSIGGPGFSTEIVTVQSGRESRNQNWSSCRWQGQLNLVAQTEMNFRPIRAFFMVMNGRTHCWPLKDWNDSAVALGDGAARAITTTTFQLVKRYTYLPGYTEDRDIGLPFAAGFTVRVGGTPLSGADYALDPLTGIITIPAAPDADDIDWSGSFLVRVRFDTDEMPTTTINRHGTDENILSWDSVPVIEVRPEE